MNAIILAAGMGTRLRPLTNEIPKCLVKVNGIPMVEQQIQYLHEAGIRDITLVSGYKAEKLDYLRERYGVDIILNEKYDICNNIYSMYKVLDRLKDTWIIEGDVYMMGNCFTTDIQESTYFAKWHDCYESEWGLIPDKDDYLKEIIIGDGQGLIMSGISYWDRESSAFIAEKIKDYILSNNYENLFWDQVIKDSYQQLNIRVRRFDDLAEIDTVEDLKKIEGLIIPN